MVYRYTITIILLGCCQLVIFISFTYKDYKHFNNFVSHKLGLEVLKINYYLFILYIMLILYL